MGTWPSTPLTRDNRGPPVLPRFVSHLEREEQGREERRAGGEL
ncbi:hypothetical protein E2C01_070075 [Portunus trituberculatus]|uniref:Uncharacterized protein n=1 Tax=Portunus trituberculatus TaxID=210409 RepID=A0A5B7HWC4_PORTR|nr:hypothetical protein [Portunus trituberculatus]